MEVDYSAVAVQWLFFFGLLTMWLLPGFLFKKLALKYNRIGWVYFLIGIVVGINLSQLSIRIVHGLWSAVFSQEEGVYFLPLYFLIALVFIWLAYKILEKLFSRFSKQS